MNQQAPRETEGLVFLYKGDIVIFYVAVIGVNVVVRQIYYIKAAGYDFYSIVGRANSS